MFHSRSLFADERGAVSAHGLILGAGALLLVGMAGYELVDAGFGALVSSVDPGVERFAAGIAPAGAEDSVR